MLRIGWLISLCVLLLNFSGGSVAQDDLLSRPDIQQAMAHIEQHYPRFIEQQIDIAEIPAPPFMEQQRGEYMAKAFKRLGLKQVHTDKVGNVLGWRRGAGKGTLVVSAHLDTVFPEGTDFSVRREGNRLYGTGLADDSLGLMNLLALVETLDDAKIHTEYDLLFIATVGEEGLGDLRGVKYLFNQGPLKGKIDAFITLDAIDPRPISNQALGSKRYRVTFKGTGGHSWRDFGRVNPAHALGQLIARFTTMELPTSPKTSYSIGRIGGGTSVNSIPFKAWLEVDMRSESNEDLIALEQQFLAKVNEALAAENKFRQAGGSKLTVDLEMIGDRPSGITPANDPLITSAQWATRAVGLTPRLKSESTDANVPVSLGIPAMSIGSGGSGGDMHSPSEWYDPTDAHLGLQRTLLIILAYDQVTR